VVNFRITEQEYEEMRSICDRTGCRSISDYARAAVLEVGRTQRLLQMFVDRLDGKVTRVLALLEDAQEAGARKRC
jgi:hypothetical protein